MPDIRPFRVDVAQAQLEELRRRIKATQFPDRETVADRSQGIQLATAQKLARHWATEYDWRTVEARINAVPNFITEIDGLDIHFIHVRSRHTNALPLILTHGWPGSIVHTLGIIDPLVNPTAHGGSADDAFDVVFPSLPGFGFSGKPVTTGWDPVRIARAWPVLMQRLGYTQYVAQGGDWGAIITDLMAAQAPAGLIGIHTNMAGAVPADIEAKAATGVPMPYGLSDEEQRAYEQLVLAFRSVNYAFYMAARPQALYGIADSPAGLATWMLDPPLIARVFDGKSTSPTPDDILDNITLYWLTNTAVSAARVYWENKIPFFSPKNVTLPVAVSVFPDEMYHPPRSWAERAYPNLVYYNKADKGGHFPAWEQPRLFTEELRAGFRHHRVIAAARAGG